MSLSESVYIIEKTKRKSAVKVKATVSSFALLFLTALPVFANSLTYTAPAGEQGGRFTGELPIARIGSVALPDGLVKFSDDEMLVEAVPDWLFDREQVLRAVIVRAEVASQQNTSVVAGLVFFLDGSWLPNLGPRRTVDEIVTNAGENILGRITGRSGQAFSVQPEQGGVRKVNFSEIRSIKSPRAFAFNIPTPSARLSPTDSSFAFDSNMITLKPSTDQARIANAKARVPRSTLAGADPGVSDRAVNTFIALDIFSEIAPAIAIPLVLNPITQRHAIKQISRSLDAQLGLPSQ
jgi:hypothetical protein